MDPGTIQLLRSPLREHRVMVPAGMTAVWLTEEVRVVGLAALPTVIVASLLVLYFDWRARLQRRLAERDARHELDTAA